MMNHIQTFINSAIFLNNFIIYLIRNGLEKFQVNLFSRLGEIKNNSRYSKFTSFLLKFFS